MKKIKLEKSHIWSGIVFSGFLLIMIIVYFVGRKQGWFSMFESAEELREYVSDFGSWAPLAFFGIQVLQVIIAPLPGSVTTLFGGLLFGFWKAILISVVAVLTGSVILFLFAKYLGRPVVEKLVGEKRVDKYMEKLSARQFWVLFMMFLLPFFPDDFLCLAAGLSAIKFPGFVLMVLVTRPWGLVFSALVGSGTIKIPIIGWVLIGLASAFLLFVSLKWPDKLEGWMSERVLDLFRKKEKKTNNKKSEMLDMNIQINDFHNEKIYRLNNLKANSKEFIETEKFKSAIIMREKKINAEQTEISVNFKIEKGYIKEGNIVIIFNIENWNRENYLLMPAAIYNGNRYRAIKGEYPPTFRGEKGAGPDMEPFITNVPRLEIDKDESRIELLANDLSTPTVGYYNYDKKTGNLIFMPEVTEKGYTGISFKENLKNNTAILEIGFPGKRDHMYMACDRGIKSDDKGAEFNTYDEIQLDFVLCDFHVENISSFFKKLIENRKTLITKEGKRIMPLSKAFEIIEEKYNKSNWHPQEEYYKVATEGGMYNQWQAGWVGGGINSYSLMGDGGLRSQKRAEKTLDFIFNKMQNEKGYYYSVYYDGKIYGDDFKHPEDKNYVLLRKNADLTYFLIKQLMLMEQRGEKNNLDHYYGQLKKTIDAFVRLWKNNEQMGQFIDIEKEEIILGGTASAGIMPGVMALAYKLFSDKNLLNIAEEIGLYYYENFTAKGITNGGPSEIGQCPDSESAFALLESFVVLYENTNDIKWLERAEEAAYQALSWVVSYKFQFPKSSEFGRLEMDTIGSVYANVQNKHSAPGICTFSGDSLFKLYRATGKKLYMKAICEIAGGMPQYISFGKRKIKTREGKVLPSGFINERVNMSDWESKDGIGSVFYGSCWSEVSCMLSFNELPGIYVEKDKNIVWAIDNLDAEINEKGKVEIKNHTQYDAFVKILVENNEQDKPLHQNYFIDTQKRLIPAGQSIIINY